MWGLKIPFLFVEGLLSARQGAESRGAAWEAGAQILASFAFNSVYDLGFQLLVHAQYQNHQKRTQIADVVGLGWSPRIC